MLVDDRLATVLRADARGEAAARTQFRQLLDLLGSRPALPSGELAYDAYYRLSAIADTLPPEELDRILNRPAAANDLLLRFLAYRRLLQLSERIPADERSRIIREPGLRLRNRRIVGLLSRSDAKPAAAVMAVARLSEADWLHLIPLLPVMARGFLRHRRDLPQSAKDLLRKMGVHDLALPSPDTPPMPDATTAQPPVHQPEESEGVDTAPTEAEAGETDGIRSLLRRIEAFREGRKAPGRAPRLPLGDVAPEPVRETFDTFEFICDADGCITWASNPVAPYVVGMTLSSAAPGVIAALDDRAARDFRFRQVLRSAELKIRTETVMSGDWRIDAEPYFGGTSNSFQGYRGRMRRPVFNRHSPVQLAADAQSDRMRQILHELKTPVNAIQGFAEIIQQQVFGEAPNAYRALAAAVAVDAAKLLAAFDEIDRLARLETGALVLEEGEADLREVTLDTMQRLKGALRPRNAGFDLQVSGTDFTTAIDRIDLLTLAWRVLATVAGAMSPSEHVTIDLASENEEARLSIDLPRTLTAKDDLFSSPVPEERGALSAGMFGTGFSFRLARAEVQAAGGNFRFEDNKLVLVLPLLTRQAAANSLAARDGRAA